MTNERSTMSLSGENPDLKAMHRDLLSLVRRLELAIDDAPNAAAIAAISDQVVEVKSASPHHSSPSDELTYHWHEFWGAGHQPEKRPARFCARGNSQTFLH